MRALSRSLLYFAAGSVVVGTVFGAGFALNLARGVSREDLDEIDAVEGAKSFRIGTISGYLLRHTDRPRATMVCVHGRSANRMELFPLAHRMFHAGFNAAIWDEDGHTVHYDRRGIERLLEVVAEVSRDPYVDSNRVAVVGWSLGAAKAIGAAACDTDHRIAAVVADSPYADLKRSTFHYVTAFGRIPSFVAWPTGIVTCLTAQSFHGIDFAKCNPADWAREVPCPVFLIHGRNDCRIPSQDSEKIFAQLHSPKEIWLVDGVGHTGAFPHEPSEYVRRISDFIERYA